MTERSICGFTASTTMSAPGTASALRVTTAIPWREASRSRRSRRGCEATSRDGRPPCPPAGRRSWPRPSRRRPRSPPRMSRRASRRALMRPPSPRPAAHAPPRSPPAGAPARSSSSSATWASRRAVVTSDRSIAGAAHPQRRQALLALRPQVSRLADRLGIVAARAHRIACRGPQVADQPGRPCGLQLQAGPLEVPQRPVAPDVGGHHPPRLPRLHGGRGGLPAAGWSEAASAARYGAASAERRSATGSSGKRGDEAWWRTTEQAPDASDRARNEAGRRLSPAHRRRAPRRRRHRSAGEGGLAARARGVAQRLGAIGALPGEVEVAAAEVAVGGGRPVDRRAQASVSMIAPGRRSKCSPISAAIRSSGMRPVPKVSTLTASGRATPMA